ncbi:MAG: MerR family transcriptional regulator [Clostridiaceae bacterium]|nr:MerR family transcriptional regulator [Clostridiaceae bacterium]
MDKSEEEYSTGEVASLCGVSVRTVQYYDREKLVCPSSLSEKGWRKYTKADVERLKCICLYKTLGFSLEQIRAVMESDRPLSLLTGTLEAQEQDLTRRIESLADMRRKLRAVCEETECGRMPPLKSVDDLNRLMVQKAAARRAFWENVATVGAILSLLGLSVGLAIYRGHMPIPLFVIATAALAGRFLCYRGGQNTYICPECGQKFRISFAYGCLSRSGGAKGRMLKCPHCGHRGWMNNDYQSF